MQLSFFVLKCSVKVFAKVCEIFFISFLLKVDVEVKYFKKLNILPSLLGSGKAGIIPGVTDPVGSYRIIWNCMGLYSWAWSFYLTYNMVQFSGIIYDPIWSNWISSRELYQLYSGPWVHIILPLFFCNFNFHNERFSVST